MTLLALLVALAVGGCGGGEVAGQQQAPTVAATQTAPATSTASPATPPTSTQTHARPDPGSSATQPPATSTSTSTQPPATTQPPVTTTTTPSTTATQPADSAMEIVEDAQLTLVSKKSSTEYTQQGTVSGTYDGEMVLTAKIRNAGIMVRFTVTTDEGTVSGRGLAIVRITGAELEPIAGTVTITGGTGRFAGAHGKGLKVKGRVALDASRGSVHLTGTVLF